MRGVVRRDISKQEAAVDTKRGHIGGKHWRRLGTQAANLNATKDGWPRTIAFLKKNLGVK